MEYRKPGSKQPYYELGYTVDMLIKDANVKTATVNRIDD